MVSDSLHDLQGLFLGGLQLGRPNISGMCTHSHSVRDRYEGFSNEEGFELDI